MHIFHRDRNYIYIYNFWPREGESIALAWGGLSQCYIDAPIMSSQEKSLSKKIMLGFLIMINPCSIFLYWFFMKKTIEFRWDLLERIKRNSEDWEIKKVKSHLLNLSLTVLNLL